MFRTIFNHRYLTRGSVIPLAVAVLLGLALSATAAANAAEDRDSRGPTPIVFVHGGWADSSGWNQEITNLERRGYPVIAPANALLGLASDSAYIRGVLQTIDGPIILVGHSYGGAVISNAAVGVPNVRALAYIAGFAPDKRRVAGPARDHEPWHPDRPSHAGLPSLSAAGWRYGY